MKKSLFLLPLLGGFVLSGCTITIGNKTFKLFEKDKQEETIELEECIVKVDIKGNVNKPGLYEVKCNDRINDVINMAGGLTKNADTTNINFFTNVTTQRIILFETNLNNMNNYYH